MDEAMGDAEVQEKPDANGGESDKSSVAPDLLAPQEGDCIVYVSTPCRFLPLNDCTFCLFTWVAYQHCRA